MEGSVPVSDKREQSLRACYESFAKGDVKPLMDSLTDDIRWHVSGKSPVAGIYSGKSEVLAFFGKMMDLYRETLRLEVIDVVANDAHGVVMTKESAEHNGKSLEFRAVHVWGVRNGKFSQFHVYFDDAYHRFWT